MGAKEGVGLSEVGLIGAMVGVVAGVVLGAVGAATGVEVGAGVEDVGAEAGAADGVVDVGASTGAEDGVDAAGGICGAAGVVEGLMVGGTPPTTGGETGTDGGVAPMGGEATVGGVAPIGGEAGTVVGGVAAIGGGAESVHLEASMGRLQALGNAYALVAFTEGLEPTCAKARHRQSGLFLFKVSTPPQQAGLGVDSVPVTDTYARHGVKDANAAEQSAEGACAVAPATRSVANRIAMHNR